ncbi:hypothetical protein DL96DRAFT_1622025 [Flagelloscypha sp. PMI_526]|nr:hypothetical protein DL96DRAFT_1622025 [Flagelloscypha sp. PMI_526]
MVILILPSLNRRTCERIRFFLSTMAAQGLLSRTSSPDSATFDPYTIIDSNGAPETDTKFRSASKDRTVKWHIFCVLLHLSFVMLHLALVGVMNRQLERRVHVEVGSKTTLWSTVIQILLQAYAIGYLAAALFVVQKLFLQRLLLSRQTLTKTHDEFNSWLGLGSSLLTLAKQRSARSGFRSISLITLYLAASAVVKVTTSALFQLAPISLETFQTTNARSMNPLDLETDPTNPAGTGWMEYPAQALLMQLVSFQDTRSSNFVSNLGLNESIIYDVISPIANATGEVEVDTYTVHVRCYSATEEWIGYVSEPSLEFPFALISVNQPQDMIPRVTGVGNQTYVVPMLMVYNITDDKGQYGSRLPLSNVSFFGVDNSTEDESWLLFSQNSTLTDPDAFSCGSMEGDITREAKTYPTNTTVISDFGLAICTVEVPQTKGFISASQQSLIRNGFNSGREGQSVLWTEVPYRLQDTFIRPPPYINDLKITSQSFEHAVYDGVGFDFYCKRPGSSSSQYLKSSDFLFSRIFRDYLAGLDKYTGKMTSWPVISWRDMEDALEHYFALSLFARRKATEEVARGTKSEAARQYLVNVSVISQISELQLRGLPVYLGLAASLIMLAVALWITFTTPLLVSSLDSFGVLQIVWLSKSDLLNAPGSQPTENKLRRAGLSTSVNFDEGIGRIRKREVDNDGGELKESHG